MTENLSSAQYPIIKVEDLAYVYAKPEAFVKFKQNSEDFIVREVLSFEPEGEGTHAFLYIKKTDTNTEWLIRQLARFAGVEAKNIGYAGLKDRNAVTYQWLSVNLEGIEEPDWEMFDVSGCEIIKKTYHRKKLKRGSIKHNQFQIVLRELDAKYYSDITKKVEQIKCSGVPNYFAQQRFGHSYNNLSRAISWFRDGRKIKKRSERGIILSAARSMVFNQMLSQRIEQFGWDALLEGDVMMLNGTHSVFPAENIDDELLKRFVENDIHPTTALWGRGNLTSTKQLLVMEQAISESLSNWCQGLENQGLKQERRASRLLPENLSISNKDSFFADGSSLAKVSLSVEDSSLVEDSSPVEDSYKQQNITLTFSLPSGSYATAVLREIVQF